MSSAAPRGPNPWPWVPVFILVATVIANIFLIRLATNTEDVRIPQADADTTEAAG